MDNFLAGVIVGFGLIGILTFIAVNVWFAEIQNKAKDNNLQEPVSCGSPGINKEIDVPNRVLKLYGVNMDNFLTGVIVGFGLASILTFITGNMRQNSEGDSSLRWNKVQTAPMAENDIITRYVVASENINGQTPAYNY
jgi:hypothetical protein